MVKRVRICVPPGLPPRESLQLMADPVLCYLREGVCYGLDCECILCGVPTWSVTEVA